MDIINSIIYVNKQANFALDKCTVDMDDDGMPLPHLDDPRINDLGGTVEPFNPEEVPF